MSEAEALELLGLDTMDSFNNRVERIEHVCDGVVNVTLDNGGKVQLSVQWLAPPKSSCEIAR